MLKELPSTSGVFRDASFSTSIISSTSSSCKTSGTAYSPSTSRKSQGSRRPPGSVASRYHRGVMTTFSSMTKKRMMRR